LELLVLLLYRDSLGKFDLSIELDPTPLISLELLASLKSFTLEVFELLISDNLE